MYDHLGGGFHRYSVDKFWHVPHFEKMLYDQAQLAVAYLEALPDQRRGTLRRTVLRETSSLTCGTTSPLPKAASTARRMPTASWPPVGRSTPKARSTSGRKAEIDAALGPERAEAVLRPWFDVHTKTATRPAAAIRTASLPARTSSSCTSRFGFNSNSDALAKAKYLLAELRAQRPRPHLDDKIVTAWNGLMISAYARAYQTLGRNRRLPRLRPPSPPTSSASASTAKRTASSCVPTARDPPPPRALPTTTLF